MNRISFRRKLPLFLATLTVVCSFTVSSFATTYYVSSSSGNDSNSGTSAAYPWKSINKVNIHMATFKAGDSILFKRGDVWEINTDAADGLAITCHGLNGKPITFGSYGTGSSPIIDGNNSGSVYGILRIDNARWIVVENFEITDARRDIIGMAQNMGSNIVHDIIIRNCEIHKSNDGYMAIQIHSRNGQGNTRNITIDSCTAYADGPMHNIIRFDGGVTDSTVSNCTMYGAAHHIIDVIYDGSTNCNNLSFHGNDLYQANTIIYLTGLTSGAVYDNNIHDAIPEAGSSEVNGLKLAHQGTPGGGQHISNVVIRNNRIWNIDNWPSGTGNAFWLSRVENCYIWNNTIYSCGRVRVSEGNGTSPVTNYDWQNNLAYLSTDLSLEYIDGWKYYDDDYGSDPKFIDPTSNDFHLQADSPVIDQGTYVGLPYSGAAPDLGAYEYNPGDDPPDPPTGLKLL